MERTPLGIMAKGSIMNGCSKHRKTNTCGTWGPDSIEEGISTGARQRQKMGVRKTNTFGVGTRQHRGRDQVQGPDAATEKSLIPRCDFDMVGVVDEVAKSIDRARRGPFSTRTVM